MKKTGLTEVVGYAQLVAVWAMGIATWLQATDEASISGKVVVLTTMATLAGVGTVGVLGRTAWKEGKQIETPYEEGQI